MQGWSLLVAAALVLVGCDRRQMADADGKLLVLPSKLDFTRVPMYGGADLELRLRNVGRGSVSVTEAWVEGSDGSTYAVEFLKPAPHELKPSDTDDLLVKFRPTREGLQGAVLVVRSDHPTEPLTHIPLSGQGVNAKATVNVKRLDFGRIEAQSRKSLQLTFKNISDLGIEVGNTVVGNDQDEFTVPSFPLAPFEEKVVEVAFAPERVGIKDSRIVVQPCTHCPTEEVLLVAEALDRAVVAEPWTLSFGQVAMDRDATLQATLHNISTEPMELLNFAFSANTDVSFTSPGGSFPRVLPPDGRVQYDIKYTPGHMGPASGQADYGVRSVRNPTTSVSLAGWGGAAEICISPLAWDFGEVPVGSKNGKVVNIRNCGTNNDVPLEIRGIRFGGDNVPGENQFTLEVPSTPVSLKAGEEINVTVFYEPTRDGSAGGNLHLETSLFGLEDVRVGFNGRARTSEDCRIAITPLQLDFGTVTPNRGGVLGVKVRNLGTDVCPVKNIKIRDDAGGVFVMPGGELDGFVVIEGEYFSFMVAFEPPPQGGSFLGTLQIETGDPANPLILVPLLGNSQPTCLVATPHELNFGVARPDCPPPPQEINFVNQCAQPVDLRGISIGAGTTDGEFLLEGISESLPRTLQPGQGVTVSVRYLAQIRGLNLSPLYVDVAGLAQPQLVSLIGESSSKVDRTDRFTQQDGQKVDVLFVVDNTASMVEEQPRLISALPAFVDAALSKGVDLHVAVTTTGIAAVSDACPGGARGGEAGRLFPVDNSSPRLLTQATPNLAARLQQNANVGQCAQIEQGFEAMRRALSDPLVRSTDDPRTALPNDGNAGFLRDEAALAVVFVGDEDDHSPDAVDTYLRFVRELKGASQPNRAVLFAIAPTENSCSTAGGTGNRYFEAATRTGGEVMDICSADYAPVLRNVANKAFGPQDRFPLSAIPDGTGFTVRINGAVVGSGWSYDAGTNSIVFSPMPPAAARIEISYRMVCQR